MSDEMLWNITEEELNRNKLVDPGWYPTEITDFAIEDSKKKDSKNLHLTVTIFAGENKGVINPFIYFSEKAPAMFAPMLEALGFPKNPNGTYSVKVSKELFVGKKLLAHWVRGDYEGKPVNQINEWAVLPNA